MSILKSVSTRSYAVEWRGNKLETDELFYSVDLICEGPIEGLVDNKGNTLKYSGEFNNSDVILGKGVYYDDVPIVDTKLKKFNFSTAGFRVNYGLEKDPNLNTIPSTVFRYKKPLYLNEQAFSNLIDENNLFAFFQSENGSYQNIPGNTLELTQEQISNKINDIENAKFNCNPFTHKIKNKYCDTLTIQMCCDALFHADSEGNTVQNNVAFAIEISRDYSAERNYILVRPRGIAKEPYVFDIICDVQLNSVLFDNYYVKIIPLSAKISFTNGKNFKQLSVNSISEAVQNKGFFCYPFSAIARSSVSSRHFKSDPSRTYDMKLLKVQIPNNYDAEAKEYVGNWNGVFDTFLKWTDNPAWVFYDICTNPRYGVGNGMILEEDLNKWELYKISQFCDELVKVETPSKYHKDSFTTDTKENTNYIYIAKTTTIDSSVQIYRDLESFKGQYPSVNDVDRTLFDSNSDLSNCIVFLYDMNLGITNCKKIIWEIKEGVFNSGGAFQEVASGSGTHFRIHLINDFGPRKMFERAPENILKEYNRLCRAGEDFVIQNSDNMKALIERNEINTENGAKDFILDFFRREQDGRDYKDFINEILNEPIFIFGGAQGSCTPRSFNYRDPLEPRFTANLLIDNESECLKLMNDIASIFRGITYYKNNKIISTIDVDKPVSYFFNNTNVKDGLFTYSSGSIDGNYTVAKVLYKDKYDNFNDAVEIVEDSKLIQDYGIVMKEILGFGVTSRDQAKRLGEWMLMTNRYENETVTFSTDIQAISLRPSDVIRINDFNRNNSTLMGRVLSVDYLNKFIIVDRKINLNLTGKTISFIIDSTPLSDQQINSSVDINKTLRNDIISFIIERIENNTNKIYLTSEELSSGNLISLSNIFSSTPFLISDINENNNSNLYKIVTISEADVNEYGIFAIRHDPLKYSNLDQGLLFDFSRTDSNTVSYSFSENLKPIDLSIIPTNNETGTPFYYRILPLNLNQVKSTNFDYVFQDFSDPLSSQISSEYSSLQISFGVIFNYIKNFSDEGDPYYANVQACLADNGGLLCRLISKNQSIIFKIPYSINNNNNSDLVKNIFIGRFPNSDLDSLRLLQTFTYLDIYLYNKINQIVEV